MVNSTGNTENDTTTKQCIINNNKGVCNNKCKRIIIKIRALSLFAIVVNASETYVATNSRWQTIAIDKSAAAIETITTSGSIQFAVFSSFIRRERPKVRQLC